MPSNQATNSTAKVQPDEATHDRLNNLAPVGDFLMEISNDLSEDSYFLAKSSLERFKDGMQKLDVKPPVMSGMLNLIQYLEDKVEKRKRQSHGEFSPD